MAAQRLNAASVAVGCFWIRRISKGLKLRGAVRCWVMAYPIPPPLRLCASMVVYRCQEAPIGRLTRKKDMFFLGADLDVPGVIWGLTSNLKLKYRPISMQKLRLLSQHCLHLKETLRYVRASVRGWELESVQDATHDSRGLWVYILLVLVPRFYYTTFVIKPKVCLNVAS